MEHIATENPRGHKEQPRPIRWGLMIPLGIAFVLAYLLRHVLLPFVIAAGLAYIVAPAAHWMRRRWRLPHWAAAMIAWLGVLILLGGVGVWARFVLVPQMIDLSQRMPQILRRLATQILHGESAQIMGKTISADALARSIVQSAGQFTGDGGQIVGALGMGIGLLICGVITLVLLLYYLISAQRLKNGMLWLAPPHLREDVHAIARQLDPIMASYIRGLLIVAAYAFTLTFLFTRIVIGAGYAPILALAVGLLEILLIVGPAISTIALCMIALQQESLWMLVAFAIFITVLRLSIDEFVGPIVVGRAVSLHPVVVIFSLLVGTALLGVLGVLLAVPAATAIKVTLAHFYAAEAERNRDA